jgi:hypothetical protein
MCVKSLYGWLAEELFICFPPVTLLAKKTRLDERQTYWQDVAPLYGSGKS